jgi:hypothetical protein
LFSQLVSFPPHPEPQAPISQPSTPNPHCVPCRYTDTGPTPVGASKDPFAERARSKAPVACGIGVNVGLNQVPVLAPIHATNTFPPPPVRVCFAFDCLGRSDLQIFTLSFFRACPSRESIPPTQRALTFPSLTRCVLAGGKLFRKVRDTGGGS